MLQPNSNTFTFTSFLEKKMKKQKNFVAYWLSVYWQETWFHLAYFLFRSHLPLRTFSFWFQFQCEAAIGMKSWDFPWNTHCIGSDFFSDQFCHRVLNGVNETELGLTAIMFLTRKMVEITNENLRIGLGFKTKQKNAIDFKSPPL